ncbi:anti-sigma factor [Synechococcus sp. PCC 7502]|uniref:cupin domain-containing protein n=1 Tax=Synechococcus sp. PCC 7502 TaxID=1173263 RepID=UPI00029FCBFF|nr:cupin domain-containing protein [Synechococcus sp. PCC 7502]AFY73423.1 anti-sigma factor [Synechococcus sp. PCC 7502]
MKLHADFSQRVVVDSEALNWVDSPMIGVQRRMLERDGEEVARATSIVRYAPNSHFSAHTHGGGEEFFVLEGTFSDEYGDYPAGTYVRNPVGSTHTPFSKEGCTILVKLWQMEPDDQERVAIATTQTAWLNGLVKGLQVMPLHSHKTENVALVKWDVGTQFQHHIHLGGEEIFVLDGIFEDEFGAYPKGSWLRNPKGSKHTPFSQLGCLIYVKVGHLNQK